MILQKRYQRMPGPHRGVDKGSYGDLASRAASRVATTVEEEVTLTAVIFQQLLHLGQEHVITSGDGIVVLLCVVEQLKDIVADNDAGLAGEVCGCSRHDCVAILQCKC
jgi:hypothetical protein